MEGLTGDIERVLEISSWVLLRHEEGIETPETRFDELRRWHLGEADNAGRDQVSRLGVSNDKPKLPTPSP